MFEFCRDVKPKRPRVPLGGGSPIGDEKLDVVNLIDAKRGHLGSPFDTKRRIALKEFIEFDDKLLRGGASKTVRSQAGAWERACRRGVRTAEKPEAAVGL